MTRTMFDAITPSRIPANPQMVAGYVNGNWPSYFEMLALFPHAMHVSIAVSTAADAQVLDCENGDATPAECPSWAARQRSRGQEPTVYMSESLWPYVVHEFWKAKMPEPQWWVANYDGNAVMIPGAVGKQYHNTAGYDVSIVADYWPGIDPKPVPHPTPTPLPEDEMKHYLHCQTATKSWWVIAADLSTRTAVAGPAALVFLQSQQYIISDDSKGGLTDAQLNQIPIA